MLLMLLVLGLSMEGADGVIREGFCILVLFICFERACVRDGTKNISQAHCMGSLISEQVSI